MLSLRHVESHKQSGMLQSELDSLLQHSGQVYQQAELCNLLFTEDPELVPAVSELPVFLRVQHFSHHLRSTPETTYQEMQVLEE